ncbi:hypothetical protein AB0I81_33145 [Nonomuraea sp. NPDC050404]|uniref:hypothetical protein n=1 Tax=Nonomuraea sp. NPDC050404 TaxID=3155783 RepID=UPI0033EB5C76
MSAADLAMFSPYRDAHRNELSGHWPSPHQDSPTSMIIVRIGWFRLLVGSLSRRRPIRLLSSHFAASDRHGRPGPKPGGRAGGGWWDSAVRARGVSGDVIRAMPIIWISAVLIAQARAHVRRK